MTTAWSDAFNRARQAAVVPAPAPTPAPAVNPGGSAAPPAAKPGNLSQDIMQRLGTLGPGTSWTDPATGLSYTGQYDWQGGGEGGSYGALQNYNVVDPKKANVGDPYKIYSPDGSYSHDHQIEPDRSGQDFLTALAGGGLMAFGLPAMMNGAGGAAAGVGEAAGAGYGGASAAENAALTSATAGSAPGSAVGGMMGGEAGAGYGGASFAEQEAMNGALGQPWGTAGESYGGASMAENAAIPAAPPAAAQTPWSRIVNAGRELASNPAGGLSSLLTPSNLLTAGTLLAGGAASGAADTTKPINTGNWNVSGVNTLWRR